MASATMKVLLVALAFVGTAAIVRADEGPKADIAHARHKTILLYPITGGTTNVNNPSTPVLGSTGVTIQRLAETSTTGAQIGTLYQSGIYTDVTSTDKLLNYQGTITLNQGYNFPAGKIFYVGDGTAPAATSFLQKLIVGGTGPYTHAEGKITLASDGAILITIFNW